MIKVAFDPEHDAVVVEFGKHIDAAQAKQYVSDLKRALPKDSRRLNLLIDVSSIDTAELEAKDDLEKGIDLLNAHGVAEVFYAAPDPDMDVGFNIMAASHFSKQVQVHILRSRQEAEARLYGAAA